jgi:hypothetical protein
MRARAVVGLLLVFIDRVRSRPRRPTKVSAMLGPLWSAMRVALAAVRPLIAGDSSAGLQRRRHIGETSGDDGAGEVFERQAPGRASPGTTRRRCSILDGPP